MRSVPTKLLLFFAVLSTGCDTVYYERIILLPGTSRNGEEQALTEVERQRAREVLEAQADEIPLECQDSEFAIITDSYDLDDFDLVECSATTAPEKYVQVLFAYGDSRIAVELHEIGGPRPSPFYRRLSTDFRATFEETFGPDRIIVDHPFEN